MPAVSPACTRLQYSGSKYFGYSRNACDRLDPVSTFALRSIISREKRALLWPRAMMSNDVRSGTPAFSIVASWRVKNVISFSPIARPPRNDWRLILSTRIPWRRRFDVATVSEIARSSPRTGFLLRSTPSHRKVSSRAFRSLRRTVAVAIVIGPRMRVMRLLVGDGLDLFERGDSGPDLAKSGLPQRTDAFAACLLGDVERIAVAHDDLAHLVADRHHFVDADAALVAGALAVVAPRRAERLPGPVEVRLGESGAQQRFGRDVLGTPALRAELAREALRGDQVDRRCDVERGDTHVEEPRQRRRGIVGVHGRQHQVPGLRGLDRDVGGLEVADLADHDDVRV